MAAAKRTDDVFPKGGVWTGSTAHGGLKITFRVSADGKRLSDFVAHVPYTCASGTPDGTITFHHPKPIGLSHFTGYFHLDDSGLKIANFSNDIEFYMNGFFSAHGKRSMAAKGKIGTQFDTVNGDLCNDRFDTFTASH